MTTTQYAVPAVPFSPVAPHIGVVFVTDWDRRGFGTTAVLALILRVGDALIAVADAPTVQGRESRRIWFDRNAVRDTWVHGWACDAGLVAHIEI